MKKDESSLPPEIAAWNRTRQDYPLHLTLVALIEAQVARTPSLPAVSFQGAVLSYHELNQRANRLAHFLIQHGVGTDSLVGVCMERSIEMVVALLAIVKAGGAYVPFDPEGPADRRLGMMEDSGAAILLTQSKLVGLAREGMRTVCVDQPHWDDGAPLASDNPPLRSTPDSAAYMIYTSGSTGKPKGVVNIHKGLVNRLLWMQDAYALTPQDRVLQKTPYTFDVSVWEFFWPLLTGACLVMAKPGGHRDAGYLVDTIVAERVTTMHFVPSMMNLFLAAEGLERISSLRQVMSSGEALPLELTRRFFARLPHTRLHNLYGPTEAAIDVTFWECRPDDGKNVVPIGRPIANTQIYILDESLRPLPAGAEGELLIGGVGLARGYWNRPELTATKFIPDPFSHEPGARLYRTGDLARYLPDGSIEYLGRLDFQVKLRGFRIELGEIEAAILRQPGVGEAVVVASDDALEEKQLIAYLVAKGGDRPSVAELRKHLAAELPDYMVPARFVFLLEMPLLSNGKVNRKALPKDLQQRPELAEMFVAPRTELEKTLCRVWAEQLRLTDVGTHDNFFELGGNSLRALRTMAELRKVLGRDVPVVKLFQYPSVEKLAAHLGEADTGAQALLESAYERATRIRIGRFSGNALDGVAVIGLAGRFPGAETVGQLWQNLLDRVESISRFPLEEVDDEAKYEPGYVPARGIITDADKFDAPFFGVGPLEAKVMDPQQRVFLELAWAALENAGYDPGKFPGLIGVYAGVGDNHYYARNVLSHPDLVKTVGRMIVGYGNEKDYIATRVSYSLDLTGPSVSANTGCSTSLLAVDHAFKGLIDFECDMALAGGVDIFVPQKSGQLYQEGGTFTQDGHCRPFDAEATGTMFCDGAGIVVLRRLEDAIAAGDRIYAVVRGVAKNNDGANKVSFLAPSVEGQAQVIALAQAQADVLAETIGYVEAHGTGTPLGDPIEVEALTKAFRATTDRKQFCRLGSIKGNIGHPTIASGVAGFIKLALALDREVIPATLHFAQPNPKIDFANSPFQIVSETTPWPRGTVPRRGAVSSFGFGGTNVHAILEEAPPRPVSGPSRPKQLFLMSAKSDAALGRLRQRYADFLRDEPGTNLPDMAYTLTVGRKHHAHRDFVVAGDAAAAVAELGARKPPAKRLSVLNPDIAFMFPGQGSQYVNMGRELYGDEPGFRHWVDTCCDILKPHLDRDLRELLFPAVGDEALATESLRNTYYTQPAIFTIEYALAQWWLAMGVRPSALIGHSVGEFVCACLAGVVALEDILPMVALRGRLIRGLPGGAMLSVRCAATDITGRLPDDIQLAAANGPKLCVVAGPTASVSEFAARLETEGVPTSPLHTSHAFHSAMMQPIVGPYVEAMRKVRFQPGRIPIVSTCTGDWLSDAEAANPEYWGRHLRMPVLFSNAIAKLLDSSDRVFLEIGPREVLTTLGRQHVDLPRRDRMIASLGGAAENPSEWSALLRAVGRLWVHGVDLDWHVFFAREKRQRIPLPTYPFERKSYWLDAAAVRPATPTAPAAREEAVTELAPATAGATESDEVMAALGGLVQETIGTALDAGMADSPFIALGADSLLLMQLARSVQTRFGMPVTFRQLVQEYATPNLLAQAIRETQPQRAARAQPAPAAPAPGPQTGHERSELRVLPSQREMWRLAEVSLQASCADNESFCVRLEGAVDVAILRRAVAHLPVMHEALRGHFSTDGQLFEVGAEPTIAIEEVDLSPLARPDREAAVDRLCDTEGRTFFPLKTGPLCRVVIAQLADREIAILLSAHRSVCDGWSLDNLLEDLGKVYTAMASGQPLPATPPGVGAFHQWKSGREARIRSALEHWRRALAGAPQAVAYASLRPRPGARSHAAASARRLLGAEVLGQAKAYAKDRGVSLFTLMLACFAASIRRHMASDDFLIGVPIAGHPEVGMERSVGAMASVVPLRVRGGDGQIFEEFCASAQSSLLDAQENADAGFEQVADALGVPRDPTRPHLVGVAFSHMHKYPPGHLTFGDCRVDYRINTRPFDRYDISLNVVEAPDALELVIHGNADMLDGPWLEQRLRELEDIVRLVCANPAVRLGDLAAAPAGAAPARPAVALDEVRVEAPIVVTLQRGNPDKPPLLCLLGIQLYVDVATAIDDGTRVVGIHVPMLYAPSRTPRPKLAKVAGHYLDVIRAVQPAGPYQIAGFCFAGIVAYEVARMLERQGEKVSLLVVFDSVLEHGRHIDRLTLLKEKLRDPRGAYQSVAKRVREQGRKLPVLSGLFGAASAAGEADDKMIDLPVGTPEAVADVVEFARSRPYLDTHLVGIRAARPALPPWTVIHDDMGWSGFAKSTEFCGIETHHLGIVRPPHARRAAEVIMGAMARTR